MGNLLSAVTSLRLFLLKEKSMIYHFGGRDEEDLGGGAGGNTWFLGGIKGESVDSYIL